MILELFVFAQVVHCSISTKRGLESSAPLPLMSVYAYDPTDSGDFDQLKNFEETKILAINAAKETMKNVTEDSEEYKKAAMVIKLLEATLSVVVSKTPNDFAKINKDTDTLIVAQRGDGKENDPFNFNKLPHQMRVVLDYFPSMDSNMISIENVIKAAYSSKLGNDDQSFFRFSTALKSIQKADSNQKSVKEASVVFIKGDCKDKVSFLSLTSGQVKFVESNLTANIFISKDIIMIDETGKGINSEYVMTTYTGAIPEIFYPVKRLYLVINEEYGYSPRCGIVFTEIGISLKTSDTLGCIVEALTSIKYSLATEQRGYVSMFSAIDLEIKGTVTEIPSFNISLQEMTVNTGLIDLEAAEGKILVTQTGPWDKLNKKPTIIIDTSDPSKIEIDSSVKNINIQTGTSISPENPKKGLGAGEIVGIVIGCLAVVAIVVGLCVYFLVFKKKKVEST